MLVTIEQALALVPDAVPNAGRAVLSPVAELIWSGQAADELRDWEGAAEPYVTNDGCRLILPLPTGGVAVAEPGVGVLADRGQVQILQVLSSMAGGTVLMAARTAEAARRAAALEQTRHRLREQAVLLRELAVIDELTGLHNRRFFDCRLSHELDRFERYRHPLSLVLLDVDHFKRVNDTYGHDMGDDVLRHLAGIGQALIRRVDLFARFGGEEFALLLPDTGPEGALVAAERMRKRVEETPVTIDGQEIAITISVGVSSTSDRFTGDAHGLIRAADQALYEAKRSGRNRVVVCEDSPP